MADEFVTRRELEGAIALLRSDFAAMALRDTDHHGEVIRRLDKINGTLEDHKGTLEEHGEFITAQQAVERAGDKFVSRLQWRVMAAIAATSVGVGAVSAAIGVWVK